MQILILNWRDIKNTAGGGAEILTHEMAKRWVKSGHQVIQISANYPGGKKQQIVDGVKIIRLGKWWSVHFLTIFYYFKNLRSKVDVIVDEVHWFPFFAGLYARKKTVLLACEVAQKNFYAFFPRSVAFVWAQLEKVYLFFYRGLPTLTISPSTRDELVKKGFKKERVTVLPMGLTVPKGVKSFSKEKKASLSGDHHS